MSDHTEMGAQTSPVSPQDDKEGGKVGLPKPPLFTSDYIAMAEILQFAMERFGQLVLALMYYTTDGTTPDNLPPDITMMFGIYQRKIDAAREKYNRKCVVNAENGAKGGKKKAENAKRKSGGTKFNPPTQKQFREAVAHFVDSGDIDEDVSDYESDAFFDQLKNRGWVINDKPIQCRPDWEAAIKAKFFKFNVACISHLYYPVFSAIFADFAPDGKENAGDWADNATYDFLEVYDKDANCWTVQGESFPASQWRTALVQFMKQYSDFSDT